MQRRRDTIKEILTHKISSTAIGLVVVALFGVPLVDNVLIAVTIASLTLIKDYYLRRHYNKRYHKTQRQVIMEQYYIDKANKEEQEWMAADLSGTEELLPTEIEALNLDNPLIRQQRELFDYLGPKPRLELVGDEDKDNV